MKKLFLLLLALPLLMVSCDDDDKLPNVYLKVDGSGGVSHDGYIYIMQGDELSIEGISVVAEESTTNVRITGAEYFLDYRPVWSTVIAPYAYKLETGNLPTGNHLLEIKCPVLAVGYSPAIAYVSYRIKVVDSIDDMPEDDGTVTVSGSFEAEIHEQ